MKFKNYLKTIVSGLLCSLSISPLYASDIYTAKANFTEKQHVLKQLCPNGAFNENTSSIKCSSRLDLSIALKLANKLNNRNYYISYNSTENESMERDLGLIIYENNKIIYKNLGLMKSGFFANTPEILKNLDKEFKLSILSLGSYQNILALIVPSNGMGKSYSESLYLINLDNQKVLLDGESVNTSIADTNHGFVDYKSQLFVDQSQAGAGEYPNLKIISKGSERLDEQSKTNKVLYTQYLKYANGKYKVYKESNKPIYFKQYF